MAVPISTFFVGLNGILAFILSSITVLERTRTRIWHGESETQIKDQPNHLEFPNSWAALVENYTQKSLIAKTDDGSLLRKVRAYGNFTEYVPLALLFVITLELMNASPWILWILGSTLTISRITHAWGVITTYGPSPGRAIGFFLTGLVYIIGALTCICTGIIALF